MAVAASRVRGGRGLGRRSLPKVDSRLVTGLLLVVVSVLGGLRLFAAADHRVEVLAAARDLPPNHVIEARDLRVTRVQVGGELLAGLFKGGERRSLVGRVLLYPVAGGGLVPTASVGRSPRAGREITVPVAAEHALGGSVRVGDRVDVLASFDRGQPSARTVTIVDKAEVVAVHTSKGLFGQSAGAVGSLTVSVAPDAAVYLAFAMRNGELDVVRSTGSDTADVDAVDRSSLAGSGS